MSTVPPTPPSVILACVPLTTSMDWISSEASSRSSAPRPAPPLVPSTDMPLISTRFRSGSTPRIETCEPSPNSRESCTPVTRESASPTFLSGNWLISSATMESVTVPAFFLRSMAEAIERRVPTISTASSWFLTGLPSLSSFSTLSAEVVAGAAGAACWACAAAAANRAAMARAVPVLMGVRAALRPVVAVILLVSRSRPWGDSCFNETLF